MPEKDNKDYKMLVLISLPVIPTALATALFLPWFPLQDMIINKLSQQQTLKFLVSLTPICTIILSFLLGYMAYLFLKLKKLSKQNEKTTKNLEKTEDDFETYKKENPTQADLRGQAWKQIHNPDK